MIDTGMPGSSNHKTLRQQLASYVDGLADAESIGAALSAPLFNGKPDALVDGLALAYAEFTSGDRPEAWFRDVVAQAISTHAPS
jgi:hypothetical protein